jgi:hypothetical protein
MEKIQESNVKTSAWKFCEDENGIMYSVQFDEVPWKFRKSLNEAMKDWNASGTGWHKTSGNQILLYKKYFKSQEDWEKWASSFPLQITEKKYWGDREKVVIHGKKSK